jgi:circadian clock protein KaiB
MKSGKPANDAKAFERTLADREAAERYHLRLFVSGSSPKSLRAIENIRGMCDEELPGGCELEVVDIYQQPERLLRDQIIFTPTLVKDRPLPVRRIVGDLSDHEKVLRNLDVPRRNPTVH